MKTYALGLLCALVAPIAVAGDGINTIDLTFTGTVVQPSCKIVFDNNAASKVIDFGTLNVSDLRYYAAGVVDTYTYSKTRQSDIFQLQISGCTPESLTKDSKGKQFTMTIAAAGDAQWVPGTSGGYMAGGLYPATGASDFAARILVPRSWPATEAPDTWNVFTVTGSNQGRFDDQSNVKGFTTSLAVSLDDLLASGSGDSRVWALPMRTEVGMRGTLPGTNTGQFSVSAVISVAYY